MWFKGFFMLHNFEGTVFDVCFASLLAIGLISLPFLLLVPPAIYLISAEGEGGRLGRGVGVRLASHRFPTFVSNDTRRAAFFFFNHYFCGVSPETWRASSIYG